MFIKKNKKEKYRPANTMLPPWKKYPGVSPESARWHMGDPERYLAFFESWYSCLSDKEANKVCYPVPPEWKHRFSAWESHRLQKQIDALVERKKVWDEEGVLLLGKGGTGFKRRCFAEKDFDHTMVPRYVNFIEIIADAETGKRFFSYVDTYGKEAATGEVVCEFCRNPMIRKEEASNNDK